MVLFTIATVIVSTVGAYNHNHSERLQRARSEIKKIMSRRESRPTRGGDYTALYLLDPAESRDSVFWEIIMAVEHQETGQEREASVRLRAEHTDVTARSISTWWQRARDGGACLSLNSRNTGAQASAPRMIGRRAAQARPESRSTMRWLCWCELSRETQRLNITAVAAYWCYV